MATESLMTQRMLALSKAQRVRIGMANVRHEVHAGSLSFADALADDRAQRMEIGALLRAQHQWGLKKVQRALGSMRFPVSEHRRIEDLTAHHVSELVERVEGSS